MITPEAQAIIDDLKSKLKKAEDENAELKNQIEEAKRVIEENDDEELFEGIFD